MQVVLTSMFYDGPGPLDSEKITVEREQDPEKGPQNCQVKQKVILTPKLFGVFPRKHLLDL